MRDGSTHPYRYLRGVWEGGLAVSPYEINVILHYYSRVGDHDDMERNPPGWGQTMALFTDNGLIRRAVYRDERHPRCYELTERGTAYCEALQRVPLPVQVWVTPAVPEFTHGHAA